METMNAKLPLVAIVGPTASGKTSLAVELAEALGGEIICADSRTIYRGMDIGTAKPSKEEQSRVPHWGLDLVYPNQTFSVSDFKDYAQHKIAETRSRGKVPFLVGGTGLYIDSVLFDYQFGGHADTALREHLENLSLSELHIYCSDNNIKLPENKHNKRYVIRAIERNGYDLKSRLAPDPYTYIVGIATEKALLRERIALRCEQLFSQPVVEEAKILGEMYGWDSEAMTGNIYPIIHSYVRDEITLDEAKRKFEQLDWALAKRQLTWFRRNPYIMWLLQDDITPFVKKLFAAD